MLIVGGRASGKRTFACEALGHVPHDFICASDLADAPEGARFASPRDGSCAPRVAYRCEELVRRLAPEEAFSLLAGFDAVLLESVGSGIVPACEAERDWRERVGRLGCLLAGAADVVVRMTCGIGQVIKGSLPEYAGKPACGETMRANADARYAACPLRVVLVRHGHTAATAVRSYSGAGCDEPLSKAGVRALEKIGPDTSVRSVFTSGTARTGQTAHILFPHAKQKAVLGLREMDFGDFEGKAFPELSNDARYRAWVDGGCAAACPGGEDKAAFARRVVRAFRAVCEQEALSGAASAVFVVHAGTIRAVLSELAEPVIAYFDTQTQPGGAWGAVWEDGVLKEVRAIRGAQVK